jgi:RHS repeat-associated protein
LLGEYDSTGKVIREYVWLDSLAAMQGAGGASLPIAVFTPDPAIAGSNGLSAAGVPTAAATNSTPLVYYIHADHLNTARVITSNRLNTAAAGAPQDNIRWSWLPASANQTTVNVSAGDPFGATPANANPSALAAGNFTFNLRFAGQYFDKESSLHYNHHRDYDPTLGRYVQSDPIGLAGGLNTYLYVGADPNGGVDPDGLQSAIPREVPRISIPAWVPRTPIPAWVAPAAGGAAAAVGVFSAAYSVGGAINDRFEVQIADAIDWCMSGSPHDKEKRRKYCDDLYEDIVADCRAERNARKRKACFAAASITLARCLQGRD